MIVVTCRERRGELDDAGFGPQLLQEASRMIKKALTLAALVAVALVLASPTVAETGAETTIAPFSVELIGADADAWIDRFKVQATVCPRSVCIELCQDALTNCFLSGGGFAQCLQFYDYCESDCYLNCNN